jgi:hypothetical protein
MIIDIRKYLEKLCPDPKYDYSVPNEGGNEIDYDAVVWYDERAKPSWAEIVALYEEDIQE